ncbi:endonuclease exonuclease phosphatase domain-containing [Cyclospora cayetanensis]|uniref:Endonuclease exonuclease phosphatase domain-containing n=1 Tax=Cyclospora cayetanensis TaxID=88456 RepID=A0A1D3CTC3_9EIME|nr:endonuclease exonuclease phosphatase domain-containing [Cyclospora cayetanensis]
MLHEEGHELLIHPKSAAVEYEAATAAAGVPLDAAGEATLAATCRAIRKNSIVRQSLAGSPSESQLSTGMPSFFELNLAIDSSLDGSDVTAWITRCDEGKQLNAAYSATFLNPGSFFYRQFSCQDQGLLPLYMVLSLFALAICANALRVYRQQRTQGSPLAAAATCCCCILGSASLLQTFHLTAYAAVRLQRCLPAEQTALLQSRFSAETAMDASLHVVCVAFTCFVCFMSAACAKDGLGLQLLRFLAVVFLMSARCCGLLLFLLFSSKGVESGTVDARTNRTLSALAVGLAVAALLSMLGASVTPDELNPAALYTTLWTLPLHIFSGATAGELVMRCALYSLSASLATIPLQRMICRGYQQDLPRMGEVKSSITAVDLPYTDL